MVLFFSLSLYQQILYSSSSNYSSFLIISFWHVSLCLFFLKIPKEVPKCWGKGGEIAIAIGDLWLRYRDEKKSPS